MSLKQQLIDINIIKPDNSINANAKKMLNGKYSYLLPSILNSTLFISKDRPHWFKEKIVAIRDNITEIPKCETCKKDTSFNTHYKKYNKFCSKKDCNKDYRLTMARHTMKEKYGAEHAFQNKEIHDKFKETMVEKYGVEYSGLSQELNAKARTTTLERYGVEWGMQAENIQQKHKNTMVEKYGVEYPSHLDTYITTCKQTSLLKYNRENFHQQHISDENYNKLNDKDWLYNQHIMNKIPIHTIAISLGYVDPKIIIRRLHEFGIEYKNYGISKNEIIIAHSISAHGIDVKSNIRSIIPPYELDIFIPSHNLAIEYCGLYWHSELYKDKKYHKIKYDLCKEKGIRLITIFEDEWVNNTNLIQNKLNYILGKSVQEKIFSRKCIIHKVSNQDKNSFFNTNHIQGDGPSSINLGLYYHDELVACIGFIKEKDDHYTLSRYTTSKNVVGGFSKLLKYFEKTYLPKKITTFADLRWSEGDIYYNNGFIMDKELPPDYSYIINYIRRLHKFNFRHKNLINILNDKYNNKLSEHENCLNNKIYRIYDCGKLRFTKVYNK